MEHDDCDDLPPPPGHPDEGLGQGCQSQRLLVSPRPIKNPVHDIQQVLLQLHLSGQQSCKMRRESFWVTLCHEGTLFISWKEPRLGIFSSLIQLVTLLTLDYKSLCAFSSSFEVIGKNVDTIMYRTRLLKSVRQYILLTIV